MTTGEHRRSQPLRAVDVIALVVFTCGWLVPIAWVGFLGGPPTSWPTTARDLYAVSCLFGEGSDRFSFFYVQVRHTGERGWRDLDEAEYFQLEPFGHRTRFDRFMARFGYRRESEIARQELSQWLATQHAQRHPDEPRIEAVRYLWADKIIDEDAPPSGCWQKPTRPEAGQITQLGRILFVDTIEGEP